MPTLHGKTAVITGASQGIGEAIAETLHAAGVDLLLLGRDRDRLEAVVSRLPKSSARPPQLIQADLRDTTDLKNAANQISTSSPAVDILVNCGGAYIRSNWDEADADTFQDLLSANVIGPYTLTRLLLPRLVDARGDVVFINSSITRSPGTGASHFKASQHALQALSDSLRNEFNRKGVRVLSVYPGRTATPRQEYIYSREGRTYDPDALLQPADVAASVFFCLSLPETAEITDLHIRPRLPS